ncbi:class I SAM-dependent methyltransferase [Deferribacter autotrophicus]|uniref:Class I SAM-dependent methyltransferase n=1 Tax=Deferribacter autotrophicus TaxID=500465 RepID=A0A5A8F145_9BACT|nr:methyltransferase domain-containing protein [Deferribacter autotrophicus]KAA0257066.1 class I SAM-dependent methyltransferase [Deferribacter autotrophicus]
MKIRNVAFKKFFENYDDWFIENENLYLSELKIFQKLGIGGESVEIGIGTGKFARPLGIKYGVEPTKEMYEKIRDKVNIVEGVAEYLPIKTGVMNWTVMITTICFVVAPLLSIKEMYRILKKNGKCALGFVDKDSPIGRLYQKKKEKSKFYKEATFFGTSELLNMMKSVGFTHLNVWQTLYGDFDEIRNNVQEPKAGYGEGSFVVIVGEKL